MKKSGKTQVYSLTSEERRAFKEALAPVVGDSLIDTDDDIQTSLIR